MRAPGGGRGAAGAPPAPGTVPGPRSPPARRRDLAAGWEAAGRAGPGAQTSGRRNFLSLPRLPRPRTGARRLCPARGAPEEDRDRRRRLRDPQPAVLGRRGFLRSILAGARAPEPEYPGSRRASLPSILRALRPMIGQDTRTLTCYHCLSRVGVTSCFRESL